MILYIAQAKKFHVYFRHLFVLLAANIIGDTNLENDTSSTSVCEHCDQIVLKNAPIFEHTSATFKKTSAEHFH